MGLFGSVYVYVQRCSKSEYLEARCRERENSGQVTFGNSWKWA